MMFANIQEFKLHKRSTKGERTAKKYKCQVHFFFLYKRQVDMPFI